MVINQERAASMETEQVALGVQISKKILWIAERARACGKMGRDKEQLERIFFYRARSKSLWLRLGAPVAMDGQLGREIWVGCGPLKAERYP